MEPWSMCLIFSIKWQVHVETDAVKHPVMNLTFFLFFWFDNIFTIREIIFNLAKVTFLLFPCTNKSRNVISLCLTFPTELARPFQIPFWIIKRKQTLFSSLLYSISALLYRWFYNLRRYIKMWLPPSFFSQHNCDNEQSNTFLYYEIFIKHILVRTEHIFDRRIQENMILYQTSATKFIYFIFHLWVSPLAASSDTFCSHETAEVYRDLWRKP